MAASASRSDAQDLAIQLDTYRQGLILHHRSDIVIEMRSRFEGKADCSIAA